MDRPYSQEIVEFRREVAAAAKEGLGSFLDTLPLVESAIESDDDLMRAHAHSFRALVRWEAGEDEGTFADLTAARELFEGYDEHAALAMQHVFEAQVALQLNRLDEAEHKLWIAAHRIHAMQETDPQGVIWPRLYQEEVLVTWGKAGNELFGQIANNN